jgi:hypothetical protein
MYQSIYYLMVTDEKRMGDNISSREPSPWRRVPTTPGYSPWRAASHERTCWTIIASPGKSWYKMM